MGRYAGSVHPHSRGNTLANSSSRLREVRFIPLAWGTRTPALGLGHGYRGSSPLAWGTHRPVFINPRPVHPARVGNTAWEPNGDRERFIPLAWEHGHGAYDVYVPVHPRGNTLSYFPSPGRFIPRVGHWSESSYVDIGSSPLAWGTRYRPVEARARRRFIPTRVGNTPDICCPPHRHTVHPHSRGEHTLLALC